MSLVDWTLFVCFLLVAGPTVELVWLASVNWTFFASPVGKAVGLPVERSMDELRISSGRAIQMVGFSGAVFAFLLSQESAHNSLDSPLFLLGISILYFFVAFRLDVVGLEKNGYREVQSRMFNYGLLAFTVALAFAFSLFLSSSPFIVPFLAIPILIAGWELAEFARDLGFYRRLLGKSPTS